MLHRLALGPENLAREIVEHRFPRLIERGRGAIDAPGGLLEVQDETTRPAAQPPVFLWRSRTTRCGAGFRSRRRTMAIVSANVSWRSDGGRTASAPVARSRASVAGGSARLRMTIRLRGGSSAIAAATTSWSDDAVSTS